MTEDNGEENSKQSGDDDFKGREEKCGENRRVLKAFGEEKSPNRSVEEFKEDLSSEVECHCETRHGSENLGAL